MENKKILIIKLLVSELKVKEKDKDKVEKELKRIKSFVQKSSVFDGLRYKVYKILNNAKIK